VPDPPETGRQKEPYISFKWVDSELRGVSGRRDRHSWKLISDIPHRVRPEPVL